MKTQKYVWRMLLALLFLGTGSALTTAQAETWDIEKIRARYAQVKAQNKQNDEHAAECSNSASVVMEHMVPGIGKQQVKYTLHFTPYQSTEDGFLIDHQLLLAEVSFNIAARTYYEEYLYEDDGRLIFAYSRQSDLQYGRRTEARWYFNGYQVLKSSIKQDAEGEEQEQELTAGMVASHSFEEMVWRAQMVREMTGSLCNAMFPDYKYCGRYSTSYDGDDFDVKGYLIEKMQEDILTIPGAAKYTTMLAAEPSEEEPYYTFKLGENQESNFCTLYWFHVYPLERLTKSEETSVPAHKGIVGRYYLIKVYDVATDQEWTVDKWLKANGAIP